MNIYRHHKIGDVDCIIYVNKSGGMWFGVVNGKPYGSHDESNLSEDSFKEHEGVLKQNAQETINKVKTL